MRIIWTASAWQQYVTWEDRKIVRRINEEHRLVYRVRDGDVEIVSCRFQYEK